MKQILNNLLFKGITEEELPKILEVLEGVVKKYKKDEVIITQGDPIRGFYIVLSGSIRVVKYDILGNMNIINFLNPPDLFGEAFYEADLVNFPISAMANTDCEVLLLKFNNIYAMEDSKVKSQLLSNLIFILSKKNIFLRNKLDIKNLPTIREKILFYLQDRQTTCSGKYFEIDFNITEFANFLGVNRSSLSRELSKMKKEGILDYDKKTYKLQSIDE